MMKTHFQMKNTMRAKMKQRIKMDTKVLRLVEVAIVLSTKQYFLQV